MNLLSWILFGAIVGIITNSLDQRAKNGVSGAIMLGVAGAVIGGLLATVLFGARIRGFDLTSFLLAAGVSLFLLSVGRVLKSG